MKTPEMVEYEAEKPRIGRPPKPKNEILIAPQYTKAEIKWIENRTFENMCLFYHSQLVALHSGMNCLKSGFVNAEARLLRGKGVLDGTKDLPRLSNAAQMILCRYGYLRVKDLKPSETE